MINPEIPLGPTSSLGYECAAIFVSFASAPIQSATGKLNDD
jgi:hypothetical protein